MTTSYNKHDFYAEHNQPDKLNEWIHHEESLCRCYFHRNIFIIQE